MKLVSPAFTEGNVIPTQFTCKGENISPPLLFSEVPRNTVTLALIMHDPDSPTGDWVHWTLWNIDPKRTELPANAVIPETTTGITSFGATGYGGPCPHSGTHRYIFELYALDTKLDAHDSTTRDELLQLVEGHILATANTMGLFSA